MTELNIDRTAAEQEYANIAHDFVKNPIGSRDWCIFWEGWCAKKRSMQVSAEPVAEFKRWNKGGSGEHVSVQFNIDPSTLPDNGELFLAPPAPVSASAMSDTMKTLVAEGQEQDDDAAWLAEHRERKLTAPVSEPDEPKKGDIVVWLRRRAGNDLVMIPGRLAGEIADHIEKLAAPVSAEPVKGHIMGRWFEAKTIDEMQAFYLSRLSAIKEAAKEVGYAIAVHGSTRRDFDLMAMAWRDGAVDKDVLAHAVAMAACGIDREGPYQWEEKPLGRSATSIPVCWTTWHDMVGAGHIDLSVVEVPAAVGFTNHLARAEGIVAGWPEWKQGYKLTKDYSLPSADAPTEEFLSAPPSTDAKDSERMFPMQHPCLPIPWKTAEIIYAGYAALYGTKQSMERMAERGGFGWGEVGIIYREPRAGNLMDKLSRAAIAAKEAGK